MEKFLNKSDNNPDNKTESQSHSQSNSNSNSHSKSIFTQSNNQNNSNQNSNQNQLIFDTQIYAKIDNENGLFVLHPDLLISPTKIAEAIGCVRRGVISDRVKGLGGFSKPAVLGNMRHAFIEVR